MKFEKDVAQICINLKSGESQHHRYSAFRLNVEELSKEIMRLINKGTKMLNLDGEYIETKYIESFEIDNYDELWELHLEREEAENEK